MIERDDPSRENGLSSLDFAVWIHEGVESSYDRTTPFAPLEQDYDGIEHEFDLMRDALRLCGVTLPDLADDHYNLDVIMESKKFTKISIEQALRTRGAILYTGSRLAISMGFNYIVHFEEDRYVYRFISEDELEHWITGYKVSELRYQ